MRVGDRLALFGADSNRGALLVRLREELARHGIQESCELPDHLTHVLPLVEPHASGRSNAVRPGLRRAAAEKMLAGMEGKQNPYESLFRCLVVMLHAEFGSEVGGQASRPSGRNAAGDSRTTIPGVR